MTNPNPAEAYERFVVQNIFVPWTADLIRRASPSLGERVLDLACGTGIVARNVAPLVGREGKVTGLDISPQMLDVARSISVPGGAAVEWYEGSGTDLPFDDGSFDLVLCQQGLQFFPDHLAGLKEIRRVMASSGRAYVSVWSELDEAPFMKAIDKVLSAHVAPGALDLPFCLSDEKLLVKLAREAGFSEVAVQKAHLTVHISDPDSFAPMMMQASAAVLPQFAAMSPDERGSLIARMQDDLREASQRFVSDGVLALESVANILAVRP